MKEGEREADLPKRVLTEEGTNALLPRTSLPPPDVFSDHRSDKDNRKFIPSSLPDSDGYQKNL